MHRDQTSPPKDRQSSTFQKGADARSGISIFIATNICENILWKARPLLTPMPPRRSLEKSPFRRLTYPLHDIQRLESTNRQIYSGRKQYTTRATTVESKHLSPSIFVLNVFHYSQYFRSDHGERPQAASVVSQWNSRYGARL